MSPIVPVGAIFFRPGRRWSFLAGPWVGSVSSARRTPPKVGWARPRACFHALRRLPGCAKFRAMKTRLITTDPEILGGTPVFTGTRVPVKNLTDCLEAGDSIDEFLADFPSVSRAQIVEFLEAARAQLTAAVA